MGDAIATYILSAAMLGSFISLAAYILGSFHGYHSAASVLALAASLYIASVSLGQATAVTVTLLLWAQFIYRIRVYLTPRPSRPQRRIHSQTPSASTPNDVNAILPAPATPPLPSPHVLGRRRSFFDP